MKATEGEFHPGGEASTPSSRFTCPVRSQQTMRAPIRVIVMGAGEMGLFFLDTLRANPENKRDVIAFIDDNPALRGTRIQSLPVLGGRDILLAAVQMLLIDEVVIAIRGLDRAIIDEIAECGRQVGCRILYFGEPFAIEQRAPALGNLPLDRLLNRPEVRIDLQAAAAMLADKTVLVTGGGGSIGSELCRQMLAMGVQRIVALDANENALFHLESELKRHYPATRFWPALGSICNERRLEEVFRTTRPHLVFHAAAHKHVPLLECNPKEAVCNNVFGTYNLARAAIRHDVEKFILISTDKAVNPTSVMGATKRIAESIIHCMDQASHTSFSAVRFGNVLGSQGSVVPTFLRQIERREPITLTHRDITRYFMTIPEAAQLVIESSRIALGSEIFILDMGEPVRIHDLACALIRMAGLVPGDDIPIEITGLRPGEKMFEELSSHSERLLSTTHSRIFEIDARPRHAVNVFRIIESMRTLLDIADEKAIAASVLESARSLSLPPYGVNDVAT